MTVAPFGKDRFRTIRLPESGDCKHARHRLAEGGAAASAALEAAWSGWIDFRVLFSPTKHALRADHDEFTTFFSESSGKIAEVRRVLGNSGVSVVEYTAKAP